LLLIYNVFTADTLRHAVTLTFDPLTLNVSVSAVTLTNCANLSEIDNQRRIYCNLNMSVLAPSAMLVLTQARLYNFAASEYENAPVRHISTKSVNVRLLYWWFNQFSQPARLSGIDLDRLLPRVVGVTYIKLGRR